MNSIHALQTHTDHQQREATMQMHHQQQQQQQQSMQQHQQETHDQQQANMTVLESLDPVQPVLSLLDPVQHQQDQQRAPILMDHHVRQQQQQHPPAQHLHQLQAPSHSSGETLQQEHQLQHQQQQQQQQQRNPQQANQKQQPPRQRPQSDGLVLDAGGPIVQWLLENYEIAEGQSLPRSTVYNHYLAHCRKLEMASVNAASFGKLIRSVFVGLKTRRLGTRGHSKYHYFGVRAKAHVLEELMQHQDSAGCSRDNDNSNQNSENGSDTDSTGGRLSSGSGKRAKRSQSANMSSTTNTTYAQYEHQHHQVTHMEEANFETANYYHNGTNGYVEKSGSNSADGIIMNGERHHSLDHCNLSDFRNHLGANWATLVDEYWPERESGLLEQQLHKATNGNAGLLVALLELFESTYKAYYKRMIELLSEFKFSDIEHLWLEFWHPSHQQQQTNQWATMLSTNGTDQTQAARAQNGQSQQSGDMSQQQTGGVYQHQVTSLSFSHIYQLTSQPLVIERINEIDYNLYAAIETFLLPDMLSPIPRALVQHIRLFAKNIGAWVEMAVKDYNPQLLTEKSRSARSFGYALRRYTSLNHLSTASRAIWEKRSALAQMSMDLSRVDLRDIEHQVSLMSQGYANESGTTLEKSGDSLNNMSSNEVRDTTTPTLQNTLDGTNENKIMEHQQQHHHNHHPQHLCTMQPAQLIQNFLHLLEDPYPANSWPDWCRNLVESRVCGLSLEEARNFIFKWNFYISLIMKELTLRSAPSLSSFQLIRLLFDEYIYYLVVNRLAQAQHKTPTQLLKSKICCTTSSNYESL